VDTQFPEDQLRIDVARTGESITVTLAGELDLATAPFLRQILSDAENESGPEVILDLRDLKFIDSVGLSVVISVHKRMAKAGRSLVIAHPADRVRKLFVVTGVSMFLNVRPAFEPTESEKTS
jgi:anti-sigma B factor antagonist